MMKVYVDEIPNTVGRAVTEDLKEREIRFWFNFGDGSEIKIERIADHDKEVRKQVCDEIRKVYVWYNVSRFNDFLDQIEKGDKE